MLCIKVFLSVFATVYDSCGGILSSLSGKIIYYGYSEESVIGIDVHCIWSIHAAENKLIRLKVDVISLDYNFINCMMSDHVYVSK